MKEKKTRKEEESSMSQYRDSFMLVEEERGVESRRGDSDIRWRGVKRSVSN